ncbi:MAG TPA: DUF2127 domain-containing protein [Verrucomicrobiae bacterium]|nr:DUF2127 domain-containing protein [Verrucomicrobiae bacterium]
MGAKKHHDIGFLAIAIFKLVKGVLLFLVGVGALSLIQPDAARIFRHWATELQVGVHSRVVQRCLVYIGVARRRDAALIAGVSFFYSALLLTEGIGLLMEKVWAEYMTAWITATFIPVEVYELIRRTTANRIWLLAVNVLVVGYLVMRLMQRGRAVVVEKAAPEKPANVG